MEGDRTSAQPPTPRVARRSPLAHSGRVAQTDPKPGLASHIGRAIAMGIAVPAAIGTAVAECTGVREPTGPLR